MTWTAFGSPLVPEVKIIMKVSVGATSRCGTSGPALGEQRRPRSLRHVEHADAGQIETVEQVAVRRVGEQDLAVGAQDVLGQRGAAAGVVDAAQHISAERRRRHRGEHLGGVAQQRADMQRPVRVGDRRSARRRWRGVGQVLAPTPHPIAVFDRRRVVVQTLAKQLLKSLRHGWHVTGAASAA